MAITTTAAQPVELRSGGGVSFFALALSGVLSAFCFALTWRVSARGVEATH